MGRQLRVASYELRLPSQLATRNSQLFPFPLDARILRHRLVPITQAAETVDGGEVSAGAGFENVGAEAAAADFAAAVLQFDVGFAQSFLALGDGADAVIGQGHFDAGQSLDGGIDGVDGAVADAGVLHGLAVGVAQSDGGGGDGVAAGRHLQADQFPQALLQFQLFIDKGFDVFVEDFLFLVGQMP